MTSVLLAMQRYMICGQPAMHRSRMLCSLRDLQENSVLTANYLKCKYTIRINFIYGAGILDAVQANFAAAANADIRRAIRQKLSNCLRPAAAKVVKVNSATESVITEQVDQFNEYRYMFSNVPRVHVDIFKTSSERIV